MADLSRRFRFGRFSLSTTGLLFCTLSFLYLVTLRYYHYASYRDPTSYFFDPIRAYERRYSSVRTAEAEKFLRDAGDIITLAGINLPSFATFIDNGNGTGKIHLTPAAGNIGVFNATISARS